MFTITEPQERQTLLEPLQALWEESVRATHDFLQESDIIAPHPAVKEGLLAVPQLAVAWQDLSVQRRKKWKCCFCIRHSAVTDWGVS